MSTSPSASRLTPEKLGGEPHQDRIAGPGAVDRGLTPLVLLCLVGVALRLLFLWLARGIDFVADEGFYVQSALSWNHYGFYGDQYRYLWPPGYPFFLSQCLALLEERGILLAKLIQVLASASIGMSTMLIARHVFGARAARLAGAIWCIYLPLIGFTHTLWTETLFLAFFLPGVLLLLPLLDGDEHPAAARRILSAGICFAAALYLKQALLLLIPVVACVLFLRSGTGLGRRLWPASLFLLAAAVPVLPWTLRNAEVYGRLVPMGSTLGENAFRGLNARYTSFDTVLVGADMRADGASPPRPRAGLTEAPAPGWERAEEIPNTIDRQGAGLERGIEFARAHPAWLARSRVQKLADWVAPLSFFLRHQALGGYADTGLGQPVVRRMTVIWAVVLPMFVLAFAVIGAARIPRRGAGILFGALFSYFLLTAFVVSMSRFRMPIIPFCIVLAAGAMGKRPLTRPLPIAIGLSLLLALWWVDLPLIGAVIGRAWGGPS